jgi:hypothetical protein
VPIEIKELHIRVSVSPPGAGTPAGAPGPAPGAESDLRQTIVAECVEQVIELLRAQRER